MFKSEQLNSLLKLAEESKNQMNLQIRIFDETMVEMVKGVPEEDKEQVEHFRALSQRAINLAKEGKSQEAQELIKNFQYGRKGN